MTTEARSALDNLSILSKIIWNLHGECIRCHGSPFPQSMTESIKFAVSRYGYAHCAPEHKRDLARCILVSKTWSSVAIPQLWRYFTQVENLVSLMADVPNTPSWYKVYYRKHKKNPSLIPARSKSWKLYSRYVQRLSVEPDDDHPQDSLLLFLKVTPLIRDAHLFPNLSSINLCGKWLSCDYSVSVLICLISPSLRQMRISFLEPLPTELLKGIIHAITKEAYNLTHLYICWKQGHMHIISKDSTTELTSLLAALRALYSISIPKEWTSPAMIDSLSHLPHLQQIDLTDGMDSVVVDDFPASFTRKILSNPGQMYPSLQILYLSGTSSELLKHLKRVFKQVHSLSVAAILFKDSPSKGVTTLISKFLPHIQHLHLNSDLHFVNPLSKELFQPLTSCTKLVELNVFRFILTSDELRGLIKAWPNLEILKLIGPDTDSAFEEFDYGFEEVRCAEMDGPDIACIGYIAETLLKLKRLIITINASSTENLGPTLRCFNSNFESLILSESLLNYRAAAFQWNKAAMYIGSLLWPRTDFHFDGLVMPGRGRNEDRILYVKWYKMFTKRFQDTVNDYVRVRFDEVSRILAFNGTIRVGPGIEMGLVNGRLFIEEAVLYEEHEE